MAKCSPSWNILGNRDLEGIKAVLEPSTEGTGPTACQTEDLQEEMLAAQQKNEGSRNALRLDLVLQCSTVRSLIVAGT